ncbi:VOC family protein [Terriglobus sp.]|uniref:VOC family protein n=1 Tax=Terriglobus sp. TaxID=1889013 RepID=UPI003AFFDAF8
MRFIPHLTFDGECEAAFRLYEECLQGNIAVLLNYGSQSNAWPAELQDKIFHATLKVGDQTLTGVDVLHSAYEKPQGFAVQLNLDEASEAERVFQTLSAGGKVHIALQKTPWAGHYAALTDRFGIPWEINCGA